MCDLLLGEGKGKGSTSYCVFYRHSSLEEKCTLGELKQWLKMKVSISVQSHQYIRVLLHLSLAISKNIEVFPSPLKTRQNCQFFAVSTRDEKAGLWIKIPSCLDWKPVSKWLPPRNLLRSTLPGNLGKSTKLAFWAGRGKSEQNLQRLSFCWRLRPNWQFQAQKLQTVHTSAARRLTWKNHVFDFFFYKTIITL